MIMRQFPVLAALIGACILGAPNVHADFLSDRSDTPAGMAAGMAHATVWTAPLSKLASIAQTFRENHAILTSTDYSFSASEFFSNSQSLLTRGSISNSAIPRTNGMILASLGLMALIARRRSYKR